MQLIGLQFHSFLPCLSKNSSQMSSIYTSVYAASLTGCPSTKSWLHILTTELPGGRFYICPLKYIIYLSSLIRVCWLHLLLCMMYFCSTRIQSRKMHCSAWCNIILQRDRERARGGAEKWDWCVLCVGDCVWRVSLDSAEWNRELTHPIFLIYELRFEQEVWVSCHHHHVLQLG